MSLLKARGAISLLALCAATSAFAADAPLSGKVTSAEEGAMEGVVVSAKRAGSTMTYSVVTNDKGEYSFPAGKLEPGQYTIKIRAVGYELDGAASADVAADKGAGADLKLRKAKNLAAQLSNAEWLASMPGSDAQKKQLYGCTNCHTLQRIVSSTHDRDEFLETMARMAQYANNSFPLRPQIRVAETNAVARFGEGATRLADYLASVNLSEQPKWSYDLKTLPRVKGRATKVFITEYDLPRQNFMAHDVITDPADGHVIFSDFGSQVIGELDPKSGKVTEHPYPLLREGYPQGALNLDRDADGVYWLALMYQGGVIRWDRKTGDIKAFPGPADRMNKATQQAMAAPQGRTVDGKVWATDVGMDAIHRIDTATGAYETIKFADRFPKGERHSAYGMNADKDNNLWFNDFSGESIGRVDAKTLEMRLFKTPTAKSRPRRGHLTDDGKLAFGEFTGDHAGVLDTKTGEMKEFPMPTAHTAPYDAALDKNGDLWTAGMETDRIVRVNTKTGETVEYPLPRQTNVRRVYVDNTTTPVTFWVGNNEGASIIKLEPVD